MGIFRFAFEIAISNLIQYGHTECHSGLLIGVVFLDGCQEMSLQGLLSGGTCVKKESRQKVDWHKWDWGQGLG